MFRTLRRGFLATLALAALGLGLAPAPVAAQSGRGTVLIMGEDGDRTSVPRQNRVFARVLQELQDFLNTSGYHVYDEAAVASSITDPNRARRTDAELIDVARAVQRPPIDYVAIFQIYASGNRSGVSDIIRLAVRIPVRVIHVPTGRFVGRFEVEGLDLPPLPRVCNTDCILERVGAEAKIIASEVGSGVTRRMDEANRANPGGTTQVSTGGAADGCTSTPAAYTIQVHGYNANEINDLEDMFSSLPCYTGHRVIRSGATFAEYWLEARVGSGRLSTLMRNTIQAIEQRHGRSAQMQMGGNTVVIRR
jgi:hypothetical protein